MSSRFVHGLSETRAPDTDRQRTRYDRCYGLLRRNNSLPTQPTASFDPDYHSLRKQGLCQAALSTVGVKLGLQIRTGEGLSTTDVMGCLFRSDRSLHSSTDGDVLAHDFAFLQWIKATLSTTTQKLTGSTPETFLMARQRGFSSPLKRTQHFF